MLRQRTRTGTRQAYHNVATSFYKLKFYEKALEVFMRIYIIHCCTLGQRHPEAIYTLKTVRNVYLESGGSIDEYMEWLNKQLSDAGLS